MRGSDRARKLLKPLQELLVRDMSSLTPTSQPSGDIQRQEGIDGFICLAVGIVTLLYLVYLRVRQRQRDQVRSPSPYSFSWIPAVTYPEAPSSSPESCPICLEDFIAGEKVKALPRCKHLYHDECISQWLTVSSPTCPVCRGWVMDPLLLLRCQLCGAHMATIVLQDDT